MMQLEVRNPTSLLRGICWLPTSKLPPVPDPLPTLPPAPDPWASLRSFTAAADKLAWLLAESLRRGISGWR